MASSDLMTQRESLEKSYQKVAVQVEQLQKELRTAQQETLRIQTTSVSKEAEMKRVLSQIHTTRLQVCVAL